ncbi:MAG TPA: amidohydrolase family protein [Steroidobacteraceae bacterium]
MIDAHQHYWQLERGDYGWLTPDLTGLYRDFLPAQLQGTLADCGVTGTLAVQAAPTEAETRFLFDLARRHASILGIVGWVDFEAHDVARRIDALMAEGGGLLIGLRPMVQDIADPAWLDRDSLDRAFGVLTERELVFDALVTPVHLGFLERRLRRHPELRCVIDHAGKPTPGARSLAAWSARLRSLANHTSAYCKLSGLLTQFEAPVTLDVLAPYVSRVFDYFGPERIIWGSDWPVLTLRAAYRDWLDLSLELIRMHAPQAGAAIFADNARRAYRLD